MSATALAPQQPDIGATLRHVERALARPVGGGEDGQLDFASEVALHFRLGAFFKHPTGCRSNTPQAQTPRTAGFDFDSPREAPNVSLDPGCAAEHDARVGMLEMYRTAIAYLDSLRDPAVEPLRAELTALEHRLADEERAERLH